MAAPVGNLVRRLEEFEKNNTPHPDPIISIYLNQIKKSFNQLQPFLGDAELKRDICEKISMWVLMSSALSVEVEDIIVLYNFHLANKNVNGGHDSVYHKLVYYIKHFLQRETSIYGEAENFVSRHSLPTGSARIDSIDQLLRVFPAGVTRNTPWWQRRFLGTDLVELMGRFSEVAIKEAKKINIEAWSMQLVRNSQAQLSHTIVTNVETKRKSSKAIRTVLEFVNMPQMVEPDVGKTGAQELEELLSIDKGEDSSSFIKVIGVIGKSGVGKSTLAAQVYEHMKRNYDCNAWVAVPPNFNWKKLLLLVLQATLRSMAVMAPHDIDEASESQLREMICRRLSEKKFMLVLDEIESIEPLKRIKNILPANCKADIICTARIRAPDYDHVVKLKGLSPQNAFNLLRKHAFLECDLSTFWSYIQPEATAILKICGGLPLALATVAGMLSTKQMEVKEWAKVHQMLVKADFIVASYADLCPVLKSCFLYTASYTSDFEVSCKKLKRLWVAEGFVQVLNDEMTLKEAAKLQLDELIQRNMIQVARVGIDGGVETCRVLSPLREFAFKRCQQDQFCITFKSAQYKILPKRPRRLFFQAESTNLADDFNNLNTSYLYSFLALKSIQQRPLFSASVNSKLLSVLELQQLPSDTLPAAIGDLCLLKYLGLRSTKLKIIPSSIKKLQQLQTLDIRDTLVTNLPASVEGLRSLKHLLLAGSFSEKMVYVPLKIEVLNNLQTILGLQLTEGVTKGLVNLLQLQKLSIGEVEETHSQDLFSSIEKMEHLRSFTMICAREKMIEIPEDNINTCKANLEKLRIGGRIENLLKWVSKLNALKHLYLWDSFLIQDPFLALQDLPNLVVLSLCNAYVGEQIEFSSKGFLKLKNLSLLCCRELAQWNEISGRAMGELQILTIGYCPKLCKLPTGFEKITSVQAVQITNMSAEFTEDAKSIKKIWGTNFSLQIRETARPSIIKDNSPSTTSKITPNPIPLITEKSVTKIESAYKYMPPRPNFLRRRNIKHKFGSHSLSFAKVNL